MVKNQFAGQRGVELDRQALKRQDATGSTKSPVVDEVTAMAGGVCTIFQRMDDAGDMLRVATTVMNPDGTKLHPGH